MAPFKEDITAGDLRIEAREMPEHVSIIQNRRKKRQHVRLTPEQRRELWEAIAKIIAEFLARWIGGGMSGKGGQHETPPNDNQGGEKLHAESNGKSRK